MLVTLLAAVEDEGRRLALAKIYHRHHEAMGKAARFLLPTRQDAEDALQNAWVKVLRHLDQARGLSDRELQFWLVAIVKNEAISLLRRRKSTEPLQEWDAPQPDPADGGDGRELAALFRRLPQTYRTTLEMKLLLGYSNKEIARCLGVTESVVRTRIHRGRAMLQQWAKEEGIDP